MSPHELNELIQVCLVSVLALGTILPLTRAIAKRIATPKNRVLAAPVDAERMERMERAIEAISIEVERVAESQRFLTRILSEGEKPAALPGAR